MRFGLVLTLLTWQLLSCFADNCAPWYPYDVTAWASCVEGASPLCRDGLQQSPIDLPTCDYIETSTEIVLNWTRTQEAVVENNGHTVVATPLSPGEMVVDKHRYILAQCHFHYGSEHTVGGHRYELCTHCVHTKEHVAPGERTHAVLGRFFTVGARRNPFFDDLLSALEGENPVVLHLGDLLSGASMSKYWSYDGSLTTPSCDEVVEWKVLMDLGVIAQDQLSALSAEIGDFSGQGNFRPTQPLNGRIVTGCSDSPCHWYPYDAEAWAECVVGASETCRDGMQQSPIDLPLCDDRPDASPRISVSWGGEQEVTIKNNGHTILIEPSAAISVMRVDGIYYTLQQCHFHHGSEHTVGGHRFELGMHCVHLKDPAKVDDGGRTHAVLGRFFTVGVGSNPLFAQLQNNLPGSPAAGDSAVISSFKGPMNPQHLLNGASMTSYWAYEGSLTTPSCDEVVEWKLLIDVGTMSETQLAAFQSAIGSFEGEGNFRPTQPRNGRPVYGCGEEQCHWYPYNAEKWATCVRGASETCRDGTEQSPIDFPQCETEADSPEIRITWTGAQQVELQNNGHTLVATPTNREEMMNIEEDKYFLQQCHFHYGSEHTVGQQQYELCMHCVHTRSGSPVNGRTHAVLGRFFRSGAENSFFTDLIASFGMLAVESTYSLSLDLGELLNGANMQRYWAYDGSLTTPSCNEIVEWKFLMDVGELSQLQLAAIAAEIGDFEGQGNFRPTQPLNGRTVAGCTSFAATTTTAPCSEWYPYDVEAWSSCVEQASPLCKTGTQQSPIDFEPCAAADESPLLEINWGGWQQVTVVNNGHTIQVRTSDPQASMKVGAEVSLLQQCHFHHGSEHTVGGAQFELALHCVHIKDPLPDSGRTHVVLGRFYTMGHTENIVFSSITQDLPSRPSEGSAENSAPAVYFIPEELLHGAELTHYWAYEGSLTTPGCNEIVDWKYLTDVGELSEAQLVAFQTALGSWQGQGNFRPTQPLNGRIIRGCDAVSCPPEAEWYPYDRAMWASCVEKASPLCAVGIEQSPIDFSPCAEPVRSPQIMLNWDGAVQATLVNNGHTVQIKPPADVRFKTAVAGEFFTLEQCHFHHGSEHTIGGFQLDMSVHCVHTRDSEHIVGEQTHMVVGMFYVRSSQENTFLDIIKEELPSRPDANLEGVVTMQEPVDLRAMFSGPDMSRYWAYNGSFTTPGCNEVVQWNFLMDMAPVTTSQIDRFVLAIGTFQGQGNFRPTQPLYGREVLGCYASGANQYITDAAYGCKGSVFVVMMAFITWRL